jgi:DNA-binding CsgD family transcriptional regulator
VTTPPPALVGRDGERAAVAAALAAVRGGATRTVAIEGEPGIGKSALLRHVAAVAADAGCAVRTARASALESDLPYGLVGEALGGGIAVDTGDRHAVHGAVRDVLGRLAARRPLALLLDDVHWADPASAEALAALVRRPPPGRLLLGLAGRQGRLPAAITAAVADAARTGAAVRLALVPLSPEDAAELLGGAVPEALYATAGGNPFYLEELARAGFGAASAGGHGGAVPDAVAAALAEELGSLPGDARRLLDAGAILGDPFAVAVAGEVAELSDTAALAAVDVVTAADLVRATATPGRFAFRHPLVREAAYAATGGGWRIAAHGRAAAVLERRGAGVVERAHHVEQAAAPGDEAAAALLETAATELQAPAPAVAARLYGSVLRVLPDRADLGRRRVALLALRADAEAAAGDAGAAQATLTEALARADGDDRLRIVVALANQEWWLGGHGLARQRLQAALADLPAAPSPDRIRLRLALGLMALLARDPADARDQTDDALADAGALGDPVFAAAAQAAGALARVLGATDDAPEALAGAADALERLTVRQRATRLVAFWMLARTRRLLGAYGAALADLERAAAIAADTGRERMALLLTVESAPVLVELGRIGDALTAAGEGVERARLAHNPRMLLWAHAELAAALLAAGEVAPALAAADDAVATGAIADLHAGGQPGWCLGSCLLASGRADRAAQALTAAFGGAGLEEMLPAERPAAAASLATALAAAGDLAGAGAALAAGDTAAAALRGPVPAATVALARAELHLARGNVEAAIAAARDAGGGAEGAPLLAARAQLVEGRALAATGARDAAVEVLLAAEAALTAAGAGRARDEAARELRRLGRRVQRPARDGVGPLTAREREIAELVAAGATSRAVAEQLVLSPRTVEAHLRNVYGKLGVRSRVELVRELDRPDGWRARRP